MTGLAERMVGMCVGESRDLTIKLPNEFEPAVLRGVDVNCKVAVSELFSYDLPEVRLPCNPASVGWPDAHSRFICTHGFDGSGHSPADRM